MVGDLELNFGVGVAVDIARDGMDCKGKKTWAFGLGGGVCCGLLVCWVSSLWWVGVREVVEIVDCKVVDLSSSIRVVNRG
jgi:hypothetical protein